MHPQAFQREHVVKQIQTSFQGGRNVDLTEFCRIG
jgi:hypothetical protein